VLEEMITDIHVGVALSSLDRPAASWGPAPAVVP
jgi:hypothetical protein